MCIRDSFTPLPTGAPEAMWFHFQLHPSPALNATRIRCVLRYFENLLGNHPGADVHGMHPVYRTEQRDWTRCETIARHEREDGQIDASWEVPGDEGPVQVALCYPYTHAQLDQLHADTGEAWTVSGIGVTENGREIQRWYNRGGEPEGSAPGIYCLARQHASETPGSWVLDGFLRHMTEQGSDAPLIWAVPFADPDAVEAGRPGKDSYPWDFNRAWGSKLFPKEHIPEYGSHPMRHEVKCIQHDLVRWTSRCAPKLLLDFHAPVTRDASGIFCFLRDVENGNPNTAHAPWVESIHRHLDPEFLGEPDFQFVRSGRYTSRWNTARLGDFANLALDVPMVNIETPYARSPKHLFTRYAYQTAGRQIAQAVIAQCG